MWFSSENSMKFNRNGTTEKSVPYVSDHRHVPQTTELHLMPIFSSTLPACAACDTFLTPTEQEANLLITSALIATRWPLPIRLLCRRCVVDASWLSLSGRR
jgi:hypothetical protein